MDFLTQYWETIVIILGFLGTLLGANSWWKYVQIAKEFLDILVKLRVIDEDSERTQDEKLELADEVLQFWDGLNPKVKAVIKKKS